MRTLQPGAQHYCGMKQFCCKTLRVAFQIVRKLPSNYYFVVWNKQWTNREDYFEGSWVAKTCQMRCTGFLGRFRG